VTSKVDVGVGASDVLDRDNDGADVHYVDDSPAPVGRPELHIDADVGVGVVEVVREGYLRDQFRGDHYRGGDRSVDHDFDGGTMCA
jgi:hypothetical protein